jgi:hypothetical protein
MKKLLAIFAALVGLVLISAPASAWEVKQTRDGNAYWEHPVSKRTVHVGEVHLQADISDVAVASSSKYVVSPVAGRIKAIYAAISSGLTGTVTYLDAWIMSTVTAGYFGTEVTNGTAKMSFTQASTGATTSFTPTANNTVTKGGVIRIGSDGGGTGYSTTPASFTIVIYPD